jgi:ATP-binding cassette subfamily B protein
VGKLIIDEVISQTQITSPKPSFSDFLKSGRLTGVGMLICIECGLGVTSDLMGRAISLLDFIMSSKYSKVTSIRLLKHASQIDLVQLEEAEQQNRVERATRQVDGRNNLVSQSFSLGQTVLSTIGLISGVAAYGPSLIVVLSAALIPAFLGEAHFNTQEYKLSVGRTGDHRYLDYLRVIGSRVEMAKEVRLFSLGGFLSDRFRQRSEEIYEIMRRLALQRATWGGVFAVISFAAYYLAYIIIAWRTVSRELSVGDLSFLVGSLLMLRGTLERAIFGFSQIIDQTQYVGELFDFLSERPGMQRSSGSRRFPARLRHGFIFENVGFRYRGSDRWAVRGLSFTLRAGEVTAVVGENGSGKTTLIKLLTRLYDPDEGRILLDEYDLRDYDIRQVWAHMGVIFQDFLRYQFSAHDNIGVGSAEAIGCRERVVHAAKWSRADDVIRKLPWGYDQLLGKEFASGVELSGGEWQTVGLARAYMRHADILILDEPTAAFDAGAEYEYFKRFKEYRCGKTGVLISHRFNTVRMADRIIVLNQGKIQEAGSHDELIAAGGRYSDLFALQASGFR